MASGRCRPWHAAGAATRGCGRRSAHGGRRGARSATGSGTWPRWGCAYAAADASATAQAATAGLRAARGALRRVRRLHDSWHHAPSSATEGVRGSARKQPTAPARSSAAPNHTGAAWRLAGQTWVRFHPISQQRCRRGVSRRNRSRCGGGCGRGRCAANGTDVAASARGHSLGTTCSYVRSPCGPQRSQRGPREDCTASSSATTAHASCPPSRWRAYTRGAACVIECTPRRGPCGCGGQCCRTAS